MRAAKAILAALVFFVCTSVFAAPGHYVVVEIDGAGHAQPVFYRAVELQERELPDAVEFTRAAMHPEQIAISGKGWRQIAEVPRFIRGEFAANGVDGEIDAHHVPVQQRSFTLRIPARAGNRVQLEFLGRKSELLIDAIAARARSLPLSGFAKSSAQPPPNSDNRVDILVLGDGYTSAEQAKFNSDVESLRVSMFGFTPYKQYASFVNWIPHFTASAQSGADHPPYVNGCTSTSCCGESGSTAADGALAGTFVNTAFDGKFCTSQIHRLVTVSSSKVLAAANAIPEADEIIVLVNDPVYGGSGGQFSVTTTQTNARLVVIHEYGHTFHRLADEYTSAYPGYPACSDVSGNAPCEANVTNQIMPAAIKWKDWLTPGIAIPTPAGTAGVGLFQGARYQTSGVYRPQNACMMRELGSNFCAVCSQEYVLRLYRGGFGVPHSGIDLIEPHSESPIITPSVPHVAGSTQVFSASILRPTPDTVSLQWYLDDQPIPGATSDSYSFTQATATPATRKLELQAFDSTALVALNVATSPANIGIMTHSRIWNIAVAPAPVTLSIADVSVIEGQGGSRSATFTVALSQAMAGGTSFSIATADIRSGGRSARAGSDYAASSLAGIIIPAGQTSASFTVKVFGDAQIEADEAFQVTLSAIIGALPGRVSATGWIINDDAH